MARARIIVVEDDATAERLLTGRLTALGYEVAGTAASGEAGVELAGRAPHDLVLVKLGLGPPVDGIEAAARIRARLGSPVIFTLDAVDDEMLRRAGRTAAVGCLVAPFSDGQLRALVELALARRDRDAPDPSVIIESVGQALLATDGDALVTVINVSAERLTGWPAAQAIGQPVVAVIALVDGPQHGPSAHPARETLRTGLPTAFSDTAAILARDGRAVPVEGGATPILGAGGAVLGAVVLLREAGDRPHAHPPLAEIPESLARLGPLTTLRESLASVADTISQPLMAIAANAASCVRWLKGEQVDLEEASRAAERIRADIRRAGEFLARLRGIARHASPVLCEFDIDQAIDDALLLVQASLMRKAIDVRTVSAQPHRVLGDRTQIQQVVLNVVRNSVEAIEAEGRPRRISIEISGRDAREVQVSIADSGAGLDPVTRERIFDPFFTTKPDCFGMGLTISRSIVEAHGGRIWAAPGSPDGTTVSFTIPTPAGRQPLARLA